MWREIGIFLAVLIGLLALWGVGYGMGKSDVYSEWERSDHDARLRGRKGP